MKYIRKLFALILIVVITCFSFSFSDKKAISTKNVLSYTVNLKKQNLKFYWKNEEGEILHNYGNLKEYVKSRSEKLIFAMNAGIFQKDHSPLGLYVENGVTLKNLNKRKSGYGNFYLQPNGIFYITNNNEGFVCKTADFKNENVKYATQSGPMLLIDGEVHPKFNKGSSNLNIRNGVGILPNGEVLFAMSKEEVNFHDFATFFKDQGCKNALYLDGAISKTYYPKEGYNETEGKFAVLIGVTENN